jgi:hypothetical protein
MRNKKYFTKQKTFNKKSQKNILKQSFAASLFLFILFVLILRKRFLTRDFADCAKNPNSITPQQRL